MRDNLPGLQRNDMVGEFGSVFYLVGDHHHGQALCGGDLAKHGEKSPAALAVQRGERFVQE
jgi:hypothetical protein